MNPDRQKTFVTCRARRRTDHLAGVRHGISLHVSATLTCQEDATDSLFW
jgi:hypothetical protein